MILNLKKRIAMNVLGKALIGTSTLLKKQIVPKMTIYQKCYKLEIKYALEIFRRRKRRFQKKASMVPQTLIIQAKTQKSY